MKQIVVKLGIYSLICLGITTFVLVNWGGSVDYFYNKFTTPRAKSMIIGDSRSLQGMQPAIFDESLENQGFDLPMFNYSFTGAQAIAGPLYNRSILKKMDSSASKGLYVISVTPEFITSKKGYDHSRGEYREAGAPPHNMAFVNMSPNFEYFFRNLNYFHFSGAIKKSTVTHKDGWLEESNLPKDSLIFKTWKKGQIDLFLKDREEYYLSELRIGSLDSLIKKLKNHGEVFMVRMPIDNDFLELEDSYYPNFDSIIDSLAVQNHIQYFNFNVGAKKKYRTYDGHHIDKFGGKEFTRDLCDSIIKSISEESN